MPKNPSPLRYPGGKAQLYPFVREIIKQNNLFGETYIELFAGGAGLALKLLLNDDVKKIIINDYDFAIYAVWYCILNFTDDFCKKILETEITVSEWDKQKNIYLNKTKNIFDMGFATFFLNRTNRSGIIKGGMIGGRKQNSKYKIDARFNKLSLVSRIKSIADQKHKIKIFNLDVIDFLSEFSLRHDDKVFINFDPPYILKGSHLYENSFTEQKHIELSGIISSCEQKWILTYDICALSENLYKKFRKTRIKINYSANKNTKAEEFVFFSDNLIVPKSIELY